VINDYQGQPIFGSNLIVDLQENNEDELRRTVTGRMAVQIEQPKLVDGMYGLSLSFGDGTEDYFQEKDCIRFEVAGMVKKTQISRRSAEIFHPSAIGCFNYEKESEEKGLLFHIRSLSPL